MTQTVATEHHGRVKSAERVLNIIEFLASDACGRTFSDISRALGLPKSSLHELLGVLTQRGYLDYDEAGRTYSLGIRIWESGQAYLRHHDLIREALPVMENIVSRVNETAQLAILDGLENVYLAKVDSTHPLRLQSEVGRRLHAHATGLGKVLLAHLPTEQLDNRLDGVALPRFTANTIADRQQLRAEFVSILQRGFAIDAEEYTPGLSCVAVPISQSQSRVVAAMSVSIPVTRLTIEQLSTSLSLLADGSLHIARRLGSATDDRRLGAYREPAAARAALVPLLSRLVHR